MCKRIVGPKVRYRIRNNSMRQNLFLSRQGKWVRYAQAATFVNQDRASAFARKHRIGPYGLFDRNPFPGKTEIIPFAA